MAKSEVTMLAPFTSASVCVASASEPVLRSSESTAAVPAPNGARSVTVIAPVTLNDGKYPFGVCGMPRNVTVWPGAGSSRTLPAECPYPPA
jgi:hypothetical protein